MVGRCEGDCKWQDGDIRLKPPRTKKSGRRLKKLISWRSSDAL